MSNRLSTLENLETLDLLSFKIIFENYAENANSISNETLFSKQYVEFIKLCQNIAIDDLTLQQFRDFLSIFDSLNSIIKNKNSAISKEISEKELIEHSEPFLYGLFNNILNMSENVKHDVSLIELIVKQMTKYFD